MSETVKVVYYTSKTLKDGSHPLMLRVSKDGKKKYQSLGVSVHPDHWDFKNGEPNDKYPNRDQLLLLIEKKKYEVQKTILTHRIEGKEYTASTLLKEHAKTSLKNNVEECFKSYIRSLKVDNRLRYSTMYDVSLSSFEKIMGTMDIPFNDIDCHWLKKYVTDLRKVGLSDNTISTRLRHLRAVFNYAIENKIITKETYPFESFKLAKIKSIPLKRALTKEEVIKILSYKPTTEMERLAISVFVFSYFTAGINFIDIAYLRYSNVYSGILIYTRNKTHKEIKVPLHEIALQIIKEYHREDKEEGDFVFPILNSFHQSDVQIANRLHKVLAKVNRDLKKIGEKLKLPIKLTTYVARHSFATVLKREGISTSLISEALGHSSEKVTKIYLDSFDNSQIADALNHLS